MQSITDFSASSAKPRLDPGQTVVEPKSGSAGTVGFCRLLIPLNLQAARLGLGTPEFRPSTAPRRLGSASRARLESRTGRDGRGVDHAWSGPSRRGERRVRWSSGPPRGPELRVMSRSHQTGARSRPSVNEEARGAPSVEAKKIRRSHGLRRICAVSVIFHSLKRDLKPVLTWTFSLRGQDLNLRPLGYEPSELPNCSTPRYKYKFSTPRKHARPLWVGIAKNYSNFAFSGIEYHRLNERKPPPETGEGLRPVLRSDYSPSRASMLAIVSASLASAVP